MSTSQQRIEELEVRLAFQDDLLEMENEPNPDGRMGIGTNAHCAHGTYSASHKYVDWRPFHYYTELVDQGAELSPTDLDDMTRWSNQAMQRDWTLGAR